MGGITEEQGDEIISLLTALLALKAIRTEEVDEKLAAELYKLVDCIKDKVEERSNVRG